VWRFRPRDLDAAVAFAFNFRPFRPIWQIRSELETFLKLVEQSNPRTIVEIGSAGGASSFLLASAMAEDGRLLCVDLPSGPFGGVAPEGRARLWRSFARTGQRVELLEADSHDQATLARVRTLLAGRRVDVLFIDGDHTYAGVKQDHEMYSPLVREGGIVAFHDIVPGPESDVGGVPRFWPEVKSPNAQEIVADWSQQGYGIGVSYVPSAAARSLPASS
jgi:predicted O-methyltransferase YrrM